MNKSEMSTVITKKGFDEEVLRARRQEGERSYLAALETKAYCQDNRVCVCTSLAVFFRVILGKTARNGPDSLYIL